LYRVFFNEIAGQLWGSGIKGLSGRMMVELFRSIRGRRAGFLKQGNVASAGIRADERDIHFSRENGYYD
jgi:hypothetical protein